MRRFEIIPIIARCGGKHGFGLGVYRWVVEGTLALLHIWTTAPLHCCATAPLHWFRRRRLRIRWGTRDDIHQAVVTIRRAIVCS